AEIAKYHYVFNTLPTATNTSTTTTRTLAADSYATQQGLNTLYVVAEDVIGNADYTNYASVDFYVTTEAPDTPVIIETFDASNRVLQSYKVAITWTEADVADESGFGGYTVERSTDCVTYEQIATTSNVSYVDSGLESRQYCYRVRARDDAGKASAYSTVTTITPTGRYTTAPGLTEKPIATTTSFAATIKWETDREAASFVEYGVTQDKIGQNSGGYTQGKLTRTLNHSVTLTLSPSTTYYYRAVWRDEDGNEGKSDIFALTTGAKPAITDVQISNITLASATISWATTTVASSEVRYGKSTAYGQVVVDQSGSTSTKHSLTLTDLDHSSTYFFQIIGTDADNNTLASDGYTFATLIKPAISGLSVEPVADAANSTLKLTWTTNVPTTSVVNYQASGTAALSKSSPDYATQHEIVVSNLADQSTYRLTARGVDEHGNEAASNEINYTTPNDTRSPKVSNLRIEIRSTGVGESQKAQIVASWETDEPATSQIEFGSGISSNSYSASSQEDATLTTNHVVIVSELAASEIYHLRAVSRDAAKNTGYSTDTTAVTGKTQRDIIGLIMNSLERSLGFLSKLPIFGR
ncbi:fibronectin type III domain-containing protein, partial [Candidatus Berkelbacteria bacterium]|nr:fibronectin type III domain-containing protein [Candidatus Berkelbacteria bacterium]